ncbi:OmpA family protein [Mesorhizobium sp. M0909]|uniref:OmpA family protein n=1 Tax=Mesorhizobium sp. M0909 TaxID=2957024 RepID=UPI003336C4E3
MNLSCFVRHLAFIVLLGSTSAFAQTDPPSPATPESAKTQSGPAPLVIHFGTGSSTILPKDREVLDQASRAFNEGKPQVMIVTGSADRAGPPAQNLLLSQRRATAVLKALLDRGLPVDRFQVLAKGETELAVPTEEGIAEPENRRVEITWR